MPSRSKQQYDVTFINYNLSKAEKASIKAWEFPQEVYEDLMVKLTQGNYKITTSYDAYSESYQAFLIPTKDNPQHQGFILAGRGSTPIKAFKQACWIHYKLLKEDWSLYQRPGTMEIDD